MSPIWGISVDDKFFITIDVDGGGGVAISTWAVSIVEETPKTLVVDILPINGLDSYR